MGNLAINVTPSEIVIIGISRDALERDIYSRWGTSTITKYIFRPSNGSTVRIPMFFALDMLYIFSELYQSKRVRTPKYTLDKIITKLKEETWLGGLDSIGQEKINLNQYLNNFAVHKPKDYQEEFIRHYLSVTKALKLKGYMLDSKPGTGKTLSLLYLSQVISKDGKKIFVVPKNAVHRVWEDTIKDLLIEDSPWWSSLSGKELNEDYKFYILHYEYLDKFEAWFSQSKIKDKDIFIGLDESHNFNRLAASRTKIFLDLCSDDRIANVVWSSGTPIAALGSECIPFLKCIDPYFDKHAEFAFSKIYGRDAKRANDILRHRIGHLKFYVPSQEAGIVNVNMQDYLVTIPNSDRFVMDHIRNELRDYIDMRMKYYNDNRAKYQDIVNRAVKYFTESNVYKRYVDEFHTYLTYFNLISKGYDPKIHKLEAQYVNNFETTIMIPNLPRPLNNEYRGARSVIKYVHLKVMGEALGKLSRYRADCFQEMVPHSHLPELIDGAAKKTIIFTSYVDVVKDIGDYLEGEGFDPILVYGETNKNLAPLVKKFFNDPKANPLVATFQSLSTAVPLIAANRIININQPFRDNIKQQSIARAARLGQDRDVDVFDVLLDTKGKENISTRNQDILEWSAEMVKSIMGEENIDLDTVSLESDIILDTDDVANKETLPAYLEAFIYKDTIYASTYLYDAIYALIEEFRIDGTHSVSKSKIRFITEDDLIRFKSIEVMSGDIRSSELTNPEDFEMFYTRSGIRYYVLNNILSDYYFPNNIKLYKLLNDNGVDLLCQD